MNRRIRIAVADDDAQVRNALRDLLRDCDFDVVGEAPDGEAAIELVRRTAPDVLLLDLKMPGFDGVEVARALSDHKYLEIVILSAYDDELLGQEAIRAGVRDFLVKGSSPREIVETLRSAGTAALTRSLSGAANRRD